ncbi:MAG TPA: hypothetical protein VF532_17490 [Candidatus Angelobacter sp.]
MLEIQVAYLMERKFKTLSTTTFILAALLVLYLTRDLVSRLFSGSIALITLLVNVLLILAVFGVLSWFAYSLFLKRYYRAWHINRIRNARFLREVMERDDR